ncbi:hypothetical protein P280DRAFT_121494 [Massarina eburnea CBS 473.64]|uniref:Uncharacterized protein n=1 Tax=Massarina eburnea CBS 473.64 TaxID=1395130 RepID=A0A6A6SF41_9PLEO|nr:hypothetical protein P280DRAFT_121494 [Massarina eburnea CBS 473.64]
MQRHVKRAGAWFDLLLTSDLFCHLSSRARQLLSMTRRSSAALAEWRIGRGRPPSRARLGRNGFCCGGEVGRRLQQRRFGGSDASYVRCLRDALSLPGGGHRWAEGEGSSGGMTQRNRMCRDFNVYDVVVDFSRPKTGTFSASHGCGLGASGALTPFACIISIRTG